MDHIFTDNLNELISDSSYSLSHHVIHKFKTELTSKNNRMVVIFSGVSSGGKTTAGDNVLNLLGDEICRVIHQDDYYKDISEINKNPFTKCTEWDDLQALKLDKIHEDVEKWLANKDTSQKLLILDGTMLMADPFLLKLSDFQFMFHVDYPIAKIRREKRDTEGDPNWVEPEPENAFELNIWPKYIEHREMFSKFIDEFELQQSSFIVDGTRNGGLICEKILQKIIS